MAKKVVCSRGKFFIPAEVKRDPKVKEAWLTRLANQILARGNKPRKRLDDDCSSVGAGGQRRYVLPDGSPCFALPDDTTKIVTRLAEIYA